MKTALSYLVVALFFGGPFALMVGPVWLYEYRIVRSIKNLEKISHTEWQSIYRAALEQRELLKVTHQRELTVDVKRDQLVTTLGRLKPSYVTLEEDALRLNFGGGFSQSSARVDIRFGSDADKDESEGIKLITGGQILQVYTSPKLTEVKDD